ncbi:MAG: hypothetical protein ACK5Y2_12400 [Bdellovibrionales bacterium]
MQQERDSLVLISEDESWIGRCKQAKQYLSLEVDHYRTVEDYLNDEKGRPRTLILDDFPDLQKGIERIHQLVRNFPQTEIFFLTSDSNLSQVPSDVAWLVAKDKMNFSYGIEFCLFQRGLCEFYDLAASELFPDTMVTFNAYHFMPLNKRFFPIVHENFVLSDDKYKKLDPLKTLYVRRNDCSYYVQYIEKYFDQFKVGLRKRTRSRFLQNLTEWRNFQFQRLFGQKSTATLVQAQRDFPENLLKLIEYWKAAPSPLSSILESAQSPYLRHEGSFLEVALACYFAQEWSGTATLTRAINLRAELSVARLSLESLLYKKWKALYGIGFQTDEDTQKWFQHFRSWSLGAPERPQEPTLLSDLKSYVDTFITREKTHLQDETLLSVYVSEVISNALWKWGDNAFQKDELVEALMARLHAEGLLDNVASEKIRELLLKESSE